jgi:DNA-binding GntR family transcriptional regulator
VAAEQAAKWIVRPQLDRLREAEELFRHAVEAPGEHPREDWTNANDLFHDAILEAGGNERLRSVVLELHRTFPRSLTWSALFDHPRLLLRNVEEHRAIREAIEHHDAASARRLMRQHILHAGELIARWFERPGSA